MARSPLESYLHIINNRFVKMANLIAANAFDVNFRFTLGTFVLFIVMTSFVMCCLYTLITYDTESVIQCATMTGIVLQAPAKFYTVLFYPKRWYANHERIQSIYVTIQQSGSLVLKEKADKFAVFYSRVIQLLMALVWLAGLAMVMNPAAIYLWSGVEFMPVIPTFIPLVDELTPSGYAICTVYHVCCVVVAACGNIVADWFFATIVMHIYLMCALFDEAGQCLNRKLLSDRDEQESRMLLKKLLQLHQDYIEYVKEVSSYYYMISTGDLYMNGFSLCTLMYTLLRMDWSPGYFLIIMIFAKLFVLCSLGTCVEIANNRVYTVVTNVLWYKLPQVSEKRQYMQMVMMAQNPIYLMAGVNQLGMETFVCVLRTVNSVAMLLLQMNE